MGTFTHLHEYLSVFGLWIGVPQRSCVANGLALVDRCWQTSESGGCSPGHFQIYSSFCVDICFFSFFLSFSFDEIYTTHKLIHLHTPSQKLDLAQKHQVHQKTRHVARNSPYSADLLRLVDEIGKGRAGSRSTGRDVVQLHVVSPSCSAFDQRVGIERWKLALMLNCLRGMLKHQNKVAIGLCYSWIMVAARVGELVSRALQNRKKRKVYKTWNF